MLTAIQPGQDITPLVMPPPPAAAPSMRDVALEEAAALGELLNERKRTGCWASDISRQEVWSRLHRLGAIYGADIWTAAALV